VDNFLVDYLKSGKAWVLVGSGPSNAMGYPSWKNLAELAVKESKLQGRGLDHSTIESAFSKKDYPAVFDEACKVLGTERLLQVLRNSLTPKFDGEIYKLIARWPVAVYLTTNYDDEIQTALSANGAIFSSYSNSRDHMGLLHSDAQGIILKLHGDLRSETGLVLKKSQYQDILNSSEWQYWRTKMTSIFQMNRVVIIGHSLTDENIRHVLEAAKEGAGVEMPVCWIAPDATPPQIREFLEQKRIRVIPYDNRAGNHQNLFRLLENVSDFIPARTSIRIRDQIARVSQSPLGDNAAAPGFFVFNQLAKQDDFEDKRVDVVLAAMQSALPHLKLRGVFSIEDAITLSGWPEKIPIPTEFAKSVSIKAISSGIIKSLEGGYEVTEVGESLAAKNKGRFEQLRDRFKKQLQLRAKRKFESLTQEEIDGLSSDIEASLVGYFREGGLSLTSILFADRSRSRENPLPSSIIKFITESSAKYDSLLMRQAFTTVSIDVFARAEVVERDYLGRISQGFFAYHSLGVFGETAVERLRQAKETLWLIDSNAQIPALALAAPTNLAFASCFDELRKAGIRLFTTYKLFKETCNHFWFALKLVEKHGLNPTELIAAATGQAPYRTSNQFLEGFIQWQAAGNPENWETYLYRIFLVPPDFVVRREHRRMKRQ
jgi:hypothetical protein